MAVGVLVVWTGICGHWVYITVAVTSHNCTQLPYKSGPGDGLCDGCTNPCNAEMRHIPAQESGKSCKPYKPYKP